MQLFIHQPLQDATSTIRLLMIEPLSEEDGVFCTLHHHSLVDEKPEFVAISYTWSREEAVPGDDHRQDDVAAQCHPLEPKTICLRTLPSIDYSCFEIGYNCRHALEQLRRQSLKTSYWIDAICIDQSNQSERNKQVPLMDQIYSLATSVFVCIDVADAFRDLARCKPVDQKMGSSKRRGIRKVLQRIGGHNYWSRMWVVQEMLKARQLVLLSNNFSVSFDVLYHLGLRFEQAINHTRLASILYYMRHLRNSETPDDESSPVLERPLSQLLWAFGRQQCKVPHDLIYGLYALMDRPSRESIAVNYSCSLEALYIAVFSLLQKCHSTWQFWTLATAVARRLFETRPMVPSINEFHAAPDTDQAFWHQELQLKLDPARLGCGCAYINEVFTEREQYRRLYSVSRSDYSLDWNIICHAEVLPARSAAGDRPQMAVSHFEPYIPLDRRCTRHKRDPPVSWIMTISTVDFVRAVLCFARGEDLNQMSMEEAYVFRADYTQSDIGLQLVKELPLEETGDPLDDISPDDGFATPNFHSDPFDNSSPGDEFADPDVPHLDHAWDGALGA